MTKKNRFIYYNQIVPVPVPNHIYIAFATQNNAGRCAAEAYNNESLKAYKGHLSVRFFFLPVV